MSQYAVCNFLREIGAYTDMRTTAKKAISSALILY